jgi:hypothetical protein
MERITESLRATGDAELQGLSGRLRRAEQDLAERLADRRAALDGADRPMSDPLYQRLFFILEGLTEQRVAAERELRQQAGALAE